MPAGIQFERHYPHPPALVWRALTDPALVEEWLMQTDLKPVEKHRFTFRTDPNPFFDGVVRCEVTDVDPQRRLAYTWSGGRGMATDVVWTLDADGDGTRVRFSHTGFSGLKGRLVGFGLKRGWRRMLDTGLPETLDRVAASG